MSLLEIGTDCISLILIFFDDKTLLKLRLINKQFNKTIPTELAHYWNNLISQLVNPDIINYYKIEFNKPNKHYLLSQNNNWKEFKNNYLPFIIYLDSFKLTTFKKSFYLIYLKYLLREYDYGYDFHHEQIEVKGCFVKKKRMKLQLFKEKLKLEKREMDRIFVIVGDIEMKFIKIQFKNLKEIPRKGIKELKEFKVERNCVEELKQLKLDNAIEYYFENNFNETTIFTTIRY
ncbi:hypothetical protein ABK040_002860 [Willaertia magna]